MARVRSIAAAQTVPIRGDVAANVAQHLRLARIAAQAQAEVLVFPELSLTGYEIGLAESLAFTPDDERLAPLVEEAASSSMTLVVGAPVRIGTSLHIGALVLAPDCGIELYTKHHLGAFSSSARCDGNVPPAESTVFRPGHRNPLVRFGGHAASVAICADTSRPSHAEEAARLGASTYLASGVNR